MIHPTDCDAGRAVLYKPASAGEDWTHRDCRRGRVTRVTETEVHVRLGPDYRPSAPSVVIPCGELYWCRV